MTPNIFINRAGRLRSGWRLAVFTAAFIFALYLFAAAYLFIVAVTRGSLPSSDIFSGRVGFVVQASIMLMTATLVGWGCNYALEDLPFRALGWTPHRGWLRDLLLGALFGGLSLSLAVAVCVLFGSYTFTPTPSALWSSVWQTLLSSAAIFLLAAAAEEALFRGYPLQTLLRSWPAWLAILPTSLAFASVHLLNPHAVAWFTFPNTALAGVWLSVAYLRTRSLWLPLGLHWGWNWTLGALLGLPVSGITWVAPTPVLRATDTGPTWLTGGHYGIEGGLACTFAFIAATIFILRLRLFSATDELKRLTDEENPLDAPTSAFKV